MSKKSLLILVSVVVLSTIMVISAAYTYQIGFEMRANVAESGAVTVTIDSTTYNTGQSLDIDWGSVSPGGTYNKQITIHNGVNNAVTPSLSITNLPASWSLTLSSNAAIPANSDSTITIILTVPSGAVAGSSSWTASLNVAS